LLAHEEQNAAAESACKGKCRPAGVLLWALAAFLALGGCARPREGAERPAADTRRSPNVVIIIADDLGWNDVGYHGSEIRTPRLDALARESVTFERFYVWPTCSPARAALLTGQSPSRFGIRAPIGLDPAGSLPLEAVTLAEALGAAGYVTGLVGKWHLGPTFEFGPRRQGFQEAYGYLHGQIDQFTHRYKDLSPSWFRDEEFIEEAGHATDLLSREAVAFIRRHRDRPFFLYLAFSVPHYPLQVEEKWLAPYRTAIAGEDRRLYAGMVSHLDHAVGAVLDALAELGLREETLVLFLSDNGGQKDWLRTDYGGAHGPYRELGDNRPLRGWKGELYEGGIRVPALASWPGRLEPRKLAEVASALDIFPTVARLAGLIPPTELGLEGSDLWPLLTGGGARQQPLLHWQTPSHAAVREGRWKLIEARRSGKLELFDQEADPHETRDLAAEEPERAAALKALLERLREREESP
jgi:arylsulfatase B